MSGDTTDTLCGRASCNCAGVNASDEPLSEHETAFSSACEGG